MCENLVRTNEIARMDYGLCEKCECRHGEQRLTQFYLTILCAKNYMNQCKRIICHARILSIILEFSCALNF